MKHILAILIILASLTLVHAPPVEEGRLDTLVEPIEPVKAKHTPVKEKPLEAPQKPPQKVYTITGDWVAQCKKWAKEAGVPLPQSAINLIDRESDCNPCAFYPSQSDCRGVWNGEEWVAPTTACGIGMQLPCGKWPGAWNDPIAGLRGMYNYVLGRYGSWEAALAHSLANNWY